MAPKKAQRTKGNVKPSSSSQAAQLLASSGHAATGFIGFSQQPAFVPVSETFDEEALDDDFRLTLRKLSKRDTVTKIKALQEFATLCSSKDEEIVKAVVPFWPRIYNKVAIDVDHKVRELSQKALAALSSKAGKAMAPHLKSIMGMWVVSMCDTYPTVASAATQAFVGRFPGSKQGDVFSFCIEEILDCLEKNITSHTKQTLSDPQTTSEEDMEAKYQRVITSSLHGLRKVMNTLPSSKVTASMTNHMTNLLETPSFWKHGKSSELQVKGGMLSMLSAVCQHCPSACEGSLAKITPFVLSFLDTAEPSIVSHAWDAILSLISAHDSCWQHVNWQKAVWPKVKKVLEKACNNQATLVAPCLLPFLDKMPNKNYGQLFDSFRLGLSIVNADTSHSEMNAFMKSFLECVQYSLRSLISSNKTTELKDIVLNQVLAVVQASLSHEKHCMAHTELYPSLCNLLTMVEASDAETEACFWSDLSAFVIGHLLGEFQKARSFENEGSKLPTPPVLFVKLGHLVECLAYGKGREFGTGQREKGVRFEETAERLGKNNYNVEERPRVKMTGCAKTFICDLQVAVYNLTEVKGKSYPQFVKLLDNLVESFAPDDAPARMLNQFDSVAVRIYKDLGLQPDDINLSKSECTYASESDSEQTPSFKLLSQWLVPKFLAVAEVHDGLDSSGYEPQGFVNTIFAFLPRDEDNRAQDVLRHLIEDTKNPVLRCQLLGKVLCLKEQNQACKVLCKSTFLTSHIERLFADSTQAKLQGTLWRELYLLLSRLDGIHDKETTIACQTAILSGCAHAFKALHLSGDKSPPDTTYLENMAICLLKMPQVVATHPLLGDLVKSLLMITLQAHFFKRDNSSHLENLWLTGLILIMKYKSAAETTKLVDEICSMLREYVSTVVTAEMVSDVIRVTRLLLSFVLLPASEDYSVETSDITSRLEFLGDSSSGSASCSHLDAWDVAVFEDALISLFVDHRQPLESETDLVEFLFLTQRLSHMPPKSSKSSRGFIQYDRAVSHLMFNSEILESGYLVQDRLASPLRDLQGRNACVRRQCAKMVLLDAAVETKKISSPDFDNWLKISKSSLSYCLLHVSKDVKQLREFASGGTDVERLGAAQLLRQHISSDHPAFRAVSSSFLNSLSLSEAVWQQVQDSLVSEEKYSSLKGHTLSQALGLALEDLLTSKTCQSVDLVNQVSACLSGFMGLAETHKLLLKKDTRLQIFQILLDASEKLKDEGIHLVTSSDSAEKISTEILSLNIVLARSLRKLVIPDCDKFWEFTLCSVVEWIHFLIDAEEKLVCNVHLQALATAVWEIIHTAALTFDSEEPVIDLVETDGTALEEDANEKKRKLVTDKALTEWNEFFSEGVFSPLMSMFLYLTSVTNDKIGDPTSWSLVINTLSAAACHLSDEVIMSHSMTAEELLTKLCPLLASGHRSVAVAAYRILQAVIRDLSKEKQEASKNDQAAKKELESDESERECRPPPALLMGVINHGQKFLGCLKLVRLGEHVVTDSGTVERAQSRSYMLAWHLVLQLCATCPADLKTEYSQYFKENGLVTELMELLFRLVPETPDPTLIEEKLNLKVDLPCQEVSKPNVESREMKTLSLQLYKTCLMLVPGQVRSWWLGLDRSPARFVETFTTDNFSPALIRLQMTSALADGQLVEGVTVKSRPSARELLATCEMTEVNITLTLTLPENFPLGQVEVECDKRVGVPSSQWQRWLRQLHVCLSQQDGGLAQGLKLWKANLDRSFQGLEDCMVCFSVLHPTSLQLPKLTCSTCRHKFHSACLYKWFSSSQKSSCPLCRNLF